MNSKIITLLVALMVVAAGASAAATAEDLEVVVAQNDATGEATVEVTQNDTAAENASVDVAVDEENVSYDGAGEYETDEDGLVHLPTPNETVTVDVTATDGDRTATATATLEAAEVDPTLPFGQQLQQYMDTIEADDRPYGHHVSSWVVENNPGNAPAHAGPPAHAGGPHADKTAENETERGPPEHAGGP